MQLRRSGWSVVPIIAALIGGFASYWSGPRMPVPRQAADICTGGLLGRPLRVGIRTWPGYAGGIVANNGFKPNMDSIYYRQYNLCVEFMLIEDVDTRAKALARGG